MNLSTLLHFGRTFWSRKPVITWIDVFVCFGNVFLEKVSANLLDAEGIQCALIFIERSSI